MNDSNNNKDDDENMLRALAEALDSGAAQTLYKTIAGSSSNQPNAQKSLEKEISRK